MTTHTSASTLAERVEAVIKAKVNPILEQHGGYATLHSVKDKDVRICFKGACQGCPSMQITMEEVVEKFIKEELLNEVEHVYVHNEVSQDLLDFAKKLMNKKNK